MKKKSSSLIKKVAKVEMCNDCGKHPIYNKKRGLCVACYQRFRKKHGPIIDKLTHNYISNRLQSDHTNKREIEFIKNFFNHTNWIHQPARFRFNEMTYEPDFYDCEKGVFIEVSGSRQAYHYRKDKYAAFRKCFSKINFEIRKTDGTILDEANAMSELYELQNKI